MSKSVMEQQINSNDLSLEKNNEQDSHCSNTKPKLINPIKLSHLSGETPLSSSLSDDELLAWENVKIDIEIVFGKTRLSLKELSPLTIGSLLPLDDLHDDLLEIYANGIKIGKGELVSCEGKVGVKIISMIKR